MHYEHTAPKVRNADAMRVWFDAWNAEVRRSIKAYEETLDLIESARRDDADPPVRCLQGLHPIRSFADVIRSSTGRWFCVKCREKEHQRNLRRFGKLPPARVYKLTEDQEMEVVRRYADDERTVTIAADFGITIGTVRNIVRRHGGAIRPTGSGVRLFWERARKAMEEAT